jgi:hypothetical protein
MPNLSELAPDAKAYLLAAPTCSCGDCKLCADDQAEALGIELDLRAAVLPPDLTVANIENALAADAELALQWEAETETQDREWAEIDYRAWLDAIEADRTEDELNRWHEDEVRRAGHNPACMRGGGR